MVGLPHDIRRSTLLGMRSRDSVRDSTGEHAHSDASPMALLDGGRDLGPEGVLDSHQCNQGQILLYTLRSILLAAPLLPYDGLFS